MVGKQLSQAQKAKIDSDARLESQRINQRYRTLRTAIRAVAAVFGVWFTGRSLAHLAGERTNIVVDAALSLVGSLNMVLGVSLTGAVAAWAAFERWLRHRKVARLQARVEELEKQHDPNRTSSMLTPQGKTNPQDKD